MLAESEEYFPTPAWHTRLCLSLTILLREGKRGEQAHGTVTHHEDGEGRLLSWHGCDLGSGGGGRGRCRER